MRSSSAALLRQPAELLIHEMNSRGARFTHPDRRIQGMLKKGEQERAWLDINELLRPWFRLRPGHVCCGCDPKTMAITECALQLKILGREFLRKI